MCVQGWRFSPPVADQPMATAVSSLERCRENAQGGIFDTDNEQSHGQRRQTNPMDKKGTRENAVFYRSTWRSQNHESMYVRKRPPLELPYPWTSLSIHGFESGTVTRRSRVRRDDGDTEASQRRGGGGSGIYMNCMRSCKCHAESVCDMQAPPSPGIRPARRMLIMRLAGDRLTNSSWASRRPPDEER